MKDFIYEGPVRIIYGAGQYKELKENPYDRKKLMEIIDSFGPMQSLFMEITTEKLADIIEEAIEGLA
ncbi:hypothetical protein ACEG19_06155 [Blautia stercoris]|uniref:hypothetical protein n=1 Tax=Blautia stercoris TaxID=871664 RepID=UPI00355C0624